MAKQGKVKERDALSPSCFMKEVKNDCYCC